MSRLTKKAVLAAFASVLALNEQGGHAVVAKDDAAIGFLTEKGLIVVDEATYSTETEVAAFVVVNTETNARFTEQDVAAAWASKDEAKETRASGQIDAVLDFDVEIPSNSAKRGVSIDHAALVAAYNQGKTSASLHISHTQWPKCRAKNSTSILKDARAAHPHLIFKCWDVDSSDVRGSGVRVAITGTQPVNAA